MQQLTNGDLRFIVSRIPKDIREILTKENVFLGGGFIRSTILQEKASDIDLFDESKESLDKLATKLALERKGKLHTTPNAFTILTSSRIPIQFITRWLFSEADKLIESFDFTIAQAVIWHDKESGQYKSLIADTYYSDLAAKRLVYTSPRREEAAGGSIMRVRKFLRKGYNIQANSLAAVILRLVEGVENFRLGNPMNVDLLCGLLREVDPLIAVDGIDMVDEHEVI